MIVVMVAMERHDTMIEKTVAKLRVGFAAARRSCIWMSAVGTDSHTISTTSHPDRSALLSLGVPTCAVSLTLDLASDAARVDKRLDAGEDEEDLEHEASFAAVPVVDNYVEYLEGHAENFRCEQRGGEADVAFLVVDRDAVDVGAHVGDANDGRHAELVLVPALRVEEGAEASEQGEEDGATCRRHLRQLEALSRHFF